MNSPDTSMTDGADAVRLVDITKTFPGVIANDKVNISIAPGEIHAICGENGAGKSVLMKTLYGMHSPDSGDIYVRGEKVKFHSPKDAIDQGIGMVHQHFMLADNLTVLENIILGSEPLVKDPRRFMGSINFRKTRRELTELNKAYGLEVDLDQNTDTLGIGQRQRVEIIKALFRGAKILILDEPTACLVPHEVEGLFNNLREMKAQGETIVFIDHKLNEVLEISDRITILRGGKTVTTVNKTETNAQQLAELMIGSSLPTPEITSKDIGDTVALEASKVSVKGDRGEMAVRDINFKVNRGEIVGIAGVEGNGQTEFIQCLLGLRSAEQGTIKMLTKSGEDESSSFQDITNLSITDRRMNGMGYIPSDRHKHGMLADAPLWENVMLGHQRQEPYSLKGMWLTRSKTNEQAEKIIEEFDVRTPSTRTTMHSLSGGNQQKLVIGKEMIMSLSLLLAAHPTRGIDIGAQAAVWEDLRIAKTSGLAIILVSADLDELIGLSDRLLVMFRGQITAELDPSNITPKELGIHMTGAKLDDVTANTKVEA